MKFYKYRIGFVLLISRLLASIFRVEFPPVVSCAGIIKDGENILLLDLTYLAGFGLPGGIIQAGETAEQTLRREILEETGLAAETARYLFSVNSSIREIPTLSLIFEVEVTGNLRQSKEGSLHWLKPADVMQRMAYQSGKQALEVYLSGKSV